MFIFELFLSETHVKLIMKISVAKQNMAVVSLNFCHRSKMRPPKMDPNSPTNTITIPISPMRESNVASTLRLEPVVLRPITFNRCRPKPAFYAGVPILLALLIHFY